MRIKILVISIVMLLAGATSEAQQRSPNPQGQQGAAPNPTALIEILNLLSQQQGAPGARGGGGRGPVDPAVEAQLRELERFINRAGGPVVVSVVNGGAWWNNATLVSQLGLTDDQKAKILKSFEDHRLTLESNKASLEKEEAQLARLLEADVVDRNAALAQIYRVANARAEMERTNATMTLEMREHLTRAQWTQLQSQTNATMRINPAGARGSGSAGERGGKF